MLIDIAVTSEINEARREYVPNMQPTDHISTAVE